jgi:crotonobetainyl-CoA:carnitine CoA-transferase CaiB-like acyl-CoA transferase
VLQAYTGLMNENRGEDGIPHRVPVIVVDMATALYAFQAVSAALYARRSEVRGRYIEVSLMQAAALLQSVNLMACHLEGGTIRQAGALQIADGWITVVVINERDWQKLCAAVEIPGLAEDPRFAEPASRLANRDTLLAILRKAFAAEPWTVWNDRLTRVELLHERLNSYAEFIGQQHVKDTGLFQWSRQAGLEASVPVPAVPGLPRQDEGTSRAEAPVPGQHTRAVLAAHGYDQTEIQRLIEEGTVNAA